jgi:hypothetical protein
VAPKCTKSNTDIDEPSRPRPKSDIEDPRRLKLLKANEEPSCRKSKTETDEPIRAKLLRESVEPKCVYSSTDSENTEPNLASPKSDTADPKRA